MNWSVEQYARFEQERNRPVRDLLFQLPETTVKRAADIGCGPGNSTEILQARYPAAVITAIDTSDEMIQAGRKRTPNIQFEMASIQEWTNPGPFDVILASAALHWVSDHESLLPALVAKLAPGGSLAVQIPDNLSEPVHRRISEIASTGAWAKRLVQGAQAGANRHTPEWYYRILHECASRVDIWRTTYHHSLAGGAADITEWFKGAALRPYLDLLDATEQLEFLQRFQESVADTYSTMPDGSVLLPFPRLFFVATR
jgi:trans-aconitate 2-methyltransferase